MDKRRILNIIIATCYLVIFIFALILCITLRAEFNGARDDSSESGWTAALTGVVLIVVLFLAVIYACMAIVPLALKSLQIFFDKRWISILCMVFDVILCALHVALLANVLTDGAEFSALLVMLFVCAFLSLGALVLNILLLTPAFAKKAQVAQASDENNI